MKITKEQYFPKRKPSSALSSCSPNRCAATIVALGLKGDETGEQLRAMAVKP